ncbi:hypothetical protein EDD22DRAFT_969033 [Suillus occidentalis]|nr:hypothetical protein EDD22DRAFT_969033 [Suillus occidentalis]
MVLLHALQLFELHDWGRNKDFLPVQLEGKQCHKSTIEDKDLGTVDLFLHTSHDKRRSTHEEIPKRPGLDGGQDLLGRGEPNILNKAEEVVKVHDSVKGHIPEPLWHHMFTNPTSATQEMKWLGSPEPTTGSRVLYILIFRKLTPITELLTDELFGVWYQCILCHITMWKEGVYHRDVSPGNLMWYKKDGKPIGVLSYDTTGVPIILHSVNSLIRYPRCDVHCHACSKLHFGRQTCVPWLPCIVVFWSTYSLKYLPALGCDVTLERVFLHILEDVHRASTSENSARKKLGRQQVVRGGQVEFRLH